MAEEEEHVHHAPTLTLEETAVDSCSRKRHAVSRGYFADPYLKHFSRDNTYINSPLMNRGYWLRVRAVESAINRFVEGLPTDNSKFQIISIGGGFDSTFFRWAGLATEADPEPAAVPANPNDAEATNHEARDFALSHHSPAGAAIRAGRLHRFVEVDQPEVVKAKRHVIARHSDLAALASLQSGHVYSEPLTEAREVEKADVLRLVAADLRQVDDVVAALFASPSLVAGEHAHEVPLWTEQPATPVMDPTVATLVLSECVLVYMRPNESLAVLQGLKNAFERAPAFGVLAYDAIRPTTPFGKQMVHNLGQRGLQLRGIDALPTPEHHKKRYLDELKFPTVAVWTMKELFVHVPAPVQKRLQNIEMLDDYDEWCLVQEHYCMSWALRLPTRTEEDKDDAPAVAAPRLFF